MDFEKKQLPKIGKLVNWKTLFKTDILGVDRGTEINSDVPEYVTKEGRWEREKYIETGRLLHLLHDNENNIRNTITAGIFTMTAFPELNYGTRYITDINLYHVTKNKKLEPRK